MGEISFLRASGKCICEMCGKTYKKHKMDEKHKDQDGNPYLNVLCDGSLVKL